MIRRKFTGAIIRPFLFALILECVGCMAAFGQEPAATPTSAKKPPIANATPVQATGTIEGSITDDDGKPLPDASVFVLAVGDQKRSKAATAAETGKFKVLDVPLTMYRIFAYAPSFVMPHDAVPAAGEQEKYYRPGEAVNISLIKGGVITGSVTDLAGEALVGVSVQAIRLPAADDSENFFALDLLSRRRETDDRGVFRIYGLPAGRYLVLAGGKAEYSFRQTPFDRDAPTFYPSSTRDTASVVTVQSGQEVSGTDIRYRNEPGSTVSGRVTGAATKNVQLLMTVAGITTPISATSSRDQDGAFSFTGVPNGDYKITALAMDDSFKPAGRGSGSTSVKGADVTGLSIRLAPLASLSGSMVRPEKPDVNCDPKSQASRDPAIVSLANLRKDDLDFLNFGRTETNIDPQGSFNMTGFGGGTFRLRTVLPDDWFIQSISRTTAKPANPKTSKPASMPQSTPPELVSIGNGENITGLTLTASSGAGSAGGSMSGAAPDISVPAGLRLLLVPTEKERTDDTLRYGESGVDRNGTFIFRNLAPGTYRLVSRIRAVDPQNIPRPLAWDAKERAKLLHDAESGGMPLEIKPCQKLNGMGLILGPDGTVKFKANQSVN
ncbi:MAG: carboxypeptidase-like regulatory domain-containing protein [Acidobacteriota bacterium]